MLLLAFSRWDHEATCELELVFVRQRFETDSVEALPLTEHPSNLLFSFFLFLYQTAWVNVSG